MAVCGYTLIMGHIGLDRTAGGPRPGSSRRQRFRLGGSTLGLTAASPADLVQQLERGFSFKTLQTLESRSGLAMSRLADIVGIPERTLARRKVSRRLTPEESERLLRISAVFEDAVDLFEGDVAAAVNWFTTPAKRSATDRPWPMLAPSPEPGRSKT